MPSCTISFRECSLSAGGSGRTNYVLTVGDAAVGQVIVFLVILETNRYSSAGFYHIETVKKTASLQIGKYLLNIVIICTVKNG